MSGDRLAQMGERVMTRISLCSRGYQERGERNAGYAIARTDWDHERRLDLPAGLKKRSNSRQLWTFVPSSVPRGLAYRPFSAFSSTPPTVRE